MRGVGGRRCLGREVRRALIAPAGASLPPVAAELADPLTGALLRSELAVCWPAIVPASSATRRRPRRGPGSNRRTPTLRRVPRGLRGTVGISQVVRPPRFAGSAPPRAGAPRPPGIETDRSASSPDPPGDADCIPDGRPPAAGFVGSHDGASRHSLEWSAGACSHTTEASTHISGRIRAGSRQAQGGRRLEEAAVHVAIAL